MADTTYHTVLLGLRRSPAAVRPGLGRGLFAAVCYAQQRRALRDIEGIQVGDVRPEGRRGAASMSGRTRTSASRP